MRKFKVTIIETVYHNEIVVEAENEGMAEEKAREEYEKGMSSDDVDFKYSIEPTPIPDDDDYPCSECGEPTGNGYDNGICCQCLGE